MIIKSQDKIDIDAIFYSTIPEHALFLKTLKNDFYLIISDSS